MKGKLRRSWGVRTTPLCGRCNDVLLVIALLLAVVVTAGQQDPRGFAAIVAHVDWLEPPMDLQTGILLEQAMAGAVSRADHAPNATAPPADARRLVASN